MTATLHLTCEIPLLVDASPSTYSSFIDASRYGLARAMLFDSRITEWPMTDTCSAGLRNRGSAHDSLTLAIC